MTPAGTDVGVGGAASSTAGPALLRATGVAAASRVVHLPATREELLRGCPPALVYTRAEQRYCALRRDLTGWGGRLAAKLAVADLLGIDGDAALEAGRDAGLHLVEIMPSPSVPCPDGDGCTKPHPPDVRFLPGPADEPGAGSGLIREDASVKVSISHTRDLAVALAVSLSERTEQP